MFHRSDFQFSRPNAAATAMMAPSRKLLGVTVMVLMMTMAFQQCCLGFTVQFQDHVTSRSRQNRHPLSPNSAPCRVGHSHPSTSTELFGGGFGGASSGSKKTKGSGSGIGSTGGGGGGGVTLKPKQQWDRYSDMKKEKKIRVAVRPSSSDSSVTSTSETEWLEVGNVKSKEDKYTELAVVRQRAIIAEVRITSYFLTTCETWFASPPPPPPDACRILV